MSKVGFEGRSFEQITHQDLLKLVSIARNDQATFFKHYPKWKTAYANRVVAIALCQGAAKHFVDRKTGINDFDIYTFYKKHPRKKLYAKRIKSYDFGDAKFGQSIDKPSFVGRRVDCLAREIDVRKSEDVIKALQRYLLNRETRTASLLSQKAMVLLEPKCGTIIWPLAAVP